MSTIAGFQLLIFSAQLALIAPVKDLSPCDVQQVERFLAQRISIKGVIAFTSHGMFWLSDSCGNRDAQDVVILFPHAANTPRVPFDLDPQANEMLRPFFRPIGPPASACASLTGQLFYKNDFRSRMAGGGPQGNGFGPRGAFRLAFVVQSVNEIHACARSDSGK